MTVQAHEVRVLIIGPPTPVRLDGVLFVVTHCEAEIAWRDGFVIGELDHDDEKNCWRARRFVALGWDEWRPMRCRAEARAFIVRGIRK